MSSIAMDHGFYWETLWNDPANAELKEKRKDPNILYAGDVVEIPEKRLREESGATAAKHRFRRKGRPEILRIRLLDRFDEPRAKIPYRLIIEGDTRQGVTNGDGELKEPIPPNARSGRLIVGEDPDVTEIPLKLGHLDPITELSGIQMRLMNLGYQCVSSDGELNEETREALRQFQRNYRLEPTGEPDESTKQTLVERHGS